MRGRPPLPVCLLLGFGLLLSPLLRAASPPTSVAGTKAPVADSGRQDPDGFPTPGGWKRKSYSRDEGSQRITEIANYSTPGSIADEEAALGEKLKQDGWTRTSRSNSGTGAGQLTMAEWTKAAKEAEVRFYAEKDGSSTLRVRVFTYADRATPARSVDKTVNAGAAPAGKADTTKAGNLSKRTGAARLGAPPTSFNVRSFNPYLHQLSWTADSWTSFDLYRRTPEGETLAAGKITATGRMDHAFLAPNTVYRLVVHHADGSEGSVEYTYANPPQPGVVSNLKAVQTGPGKVKLTWSPERPPANGVTFAETYQVTSPTHPAADRRIGTNTLELTDVPLGNHWARVALVYGDSQAMAPAPKEVSVNFDVLTDRGRYRILILGVECVHETNDNPLELDGKRDEIYAGAYTVRVRRTSEIATGEPGSFIRTKVFGDTNGFSDRIRAGTASPQGGIQTGDFVPSSAITSAQPGVIALEDRFPLLVWEGELLDSSDLLVIAPVLFSWNKGGADQWSYWQDWWRVPNNAAQVRSMARQGARPDKFAANLSWEWQADRWVGGMIDPVASALNPSDPNRKRRNGPNFAADTDRPIGMEDQNAGMFNVPYLVWNPRGLVLTRTNLEATLGRQAAVTTRWGFTDDPVSSAKLMGEYRLYLQLERLPEPTSKSVRK